jgi:hypothetical protein
LEQKKQRFGAEEEAKKDDENVRVSGDVEILDRLKRDSERWQE